MYRLFVSVELPDGVKQSLARLGNDVPGARWLEPDELHLTVRFIGEVDGVVFDDVLAALDEVRRAPFALALRGVGHFPPRGEPRILWAGLERSAELKVLHDKVESALVRAGVEPEPRKFTPHVTLARLRDASNQDVADYLSVRGYFPSRSFTADRFLLFSSRASVGGGPYIVENAYALSAEEATPTYRYSE